MEITNLTNIQDYNYERGQVYWVDLGLESQGSEQNGFRPCVVISNNKGNKCSTTLIVAILSSKVHKAKLPTHILLKRNEYKWLNKDSFIAMEQLRTIDKVRIRGFIGTLKDEVFNRALEISLGLKNIKSNSRFYKIAEEKIAYLQELKHFITIWISKGKNVDLITDEIEEYIFKFDEVNSFLIDNNLTSEFNMEGLKINNNMKLVI